MPVGFLAGRPEGHLTPVTPQFSTAFRRLVVFKPSKPIMSTAKVSFILVLQMSDCLVMTQVVWPLSFTRGYKLHIFSDFVGNGALGD